jgi:hypothetical protein
MKANGRTLGGRRSVATIKVNGIVIAPIADLDTTGSGLIQIDQGAMQRLKVGMAARS